MRGTVAVVLTGLLAGCVGLPSSGPDPRAIEYNAVARYAAPDKQTGASNYVLLEISKSVLPYFNASVRTSLRDGFGTGGPGSPVSANLGVGDVVQVAIFESQAGGLFLPQDGAASAGNYVTLPEQTIDANGNIDIPYAGEIRVAGRPVSEVQADIEDRLASRAIEPQVIITTALSRSNRLSILGAVRSPSELDLSPRGERVLDVISRAGGLTSPDAETYVTVERSGVTATALFQTLVEDPLENIFVRPGDTIHVARERRTYLAFGATGASGRVDFEDSNLTLGEALAKVGGLLDNRADPKDVFLYREVDGHVLQQLGITASHTPGKVPVIFRANLQDPATFFAVQQFLMEDKDIIYVGNSQSTEISKFLDLINGISNTSSNVPANVVDARDTFDGL